MGYKTTILYLLYIPLYGMLCIRFEVSTAMQDEYVEWRTKFDVSDVPPQERLDESESKKQHYERLAVANTLDWNGKWVDEERVTQKAERGLVDSISSSLDLTGFQKQRAWQWYKSLPKEFRTAYQLELLFIVVCGLSGREDGRSYHPNNVRAESPNEFGELANRLGIQYRPLYKCWKRIEGIVDAG